MWTTNPPSTRSERLAISVPRSPRPGTAVAPFLDRAEQLGVAQEHERNAAALPVAAHHRVQAPAFPQGTRSQGNQARGRGVVHDRTNGSRNVLFFQNLRQAPGVLRHRDDGLALGSPLLHVGAQLLQPAVIEGGGTEQIVLALAQPALERYAGPPLQLHREGRPIVEGRRKTAGQFAPFLPSRPHPVEPLFQVFRLGVNQGRRFQYEAAIRGQVFQQAAVVQQAGIERQGFQVGSGQQARQFLFHPLPHLRAAAGEVHAVNQACHPFAVGEGGELLAGGNDAHPRPLAPFAGVGGKGTLGMGVEPPDGVYLVVPQLYAVGKLGVGWEDVQDAPPVAEGAGNLHHRLAAVAQLDPTGQDLVQADALPSLPDVPGSAAAVGHDAGGQCPPQGRAHRRHHQGGRMLRPVRRVKGAGQGRQSRQTLVARIGVHGQPLEGQRLRFGQQMRRLILAQAGQQLVVQPAGVLRPRRDNQCRNAGGVPQGADVGRSGPLPDGDFKGGCDRVAAEAHRAWKTSDAG